MYLRTHRVLYAHRSIALAVAVALLAVMVITSSSYAAGADGSESVRALELQGFLAGEGDVHFLGLELAPGAPSVVLTLVYRAPDDAQVRDGVNFTVLSAEGMQAYLLGAPLANAATVQGEVLRAGPDGTIVQAALRPEAPGSYTVIVHNAWQSPTRYMLSAHGATLVDESGQTLLRVPAGPEVAPMPEASEPLVPMAEVLPAVVEPMPVAERGTMSSAHASLQVGLVNGSLYGHGDRQAFALQPLDDSGEVTVRLRYRVDGGFVPSGVINFWVLTQDGLRQVEQGALLAELNLAAGRADASGAPGRMTATVRLGAQDTYAVLVFNESAVPVDYALEVSGAHLLVGDGSEHLVTTPAQPAQSELAVARP